MEDDEEYSYTGFSDSYDEDIVTFKDDDESFYYTEGEGDEEVTFKDNEEVFTYTAYADASDAVVEESSSSYGDLIIEEFSAETTVSRVTKFTKLPEHLVIYLFAAIYVAVGVLCVVLTDYVTEWLPYIVGGMMIIIGAVRFIHALITHEYRHVRTNQTATSLIVLALGLMILVQQLTSNSEAAITFISIVWGILGLFEGAHAFNHAFKRIADSERCIYYLIRGLIEVTVAFLLLYDPANHDTHRLHIIVFGLNLILDGVTMIPQVKALLATK